MKFIDFFAGIGGFRKGMEMAGHECVGFCEFDKFATASYTSMYLITEEQREVLNKMSLKQRQKEILKEEYRNGEWYANDIRRVYAGDIPKADCWCFGFPCFIQGTYILTEKGYIPIEDVCVGDKVLTHKGRWRKVNSTMQRDNARIWDVDGFGILPTRTTAEHPYYVTKPDAPMEFRKIKQLDDTWYSTMVLPDEEPNEYSKEMWWIIGRYLADGWRVRRKDRSNGGRIVFAVNDEKRREFERRLQEAGLHGTYTKERTCGKYHVCNNKLYEYLEKFGEYAHGKRIPRESLCLSREKAEYFYNGYMSGDGRKDREEATSTSAALILGMCIIAQRLGKPVPAVYHTGRSKKCIIQGRQCRQRDTYTFRISNRSVKGHYRGRYVFRELYHPTESTDFGTVYNISVEEDESYIANGAIVHNCQDISVAGKQLGFQGNRSSLFFRVMYLIGQLEEEDKPTYLFIENVKNLLSVNGGWDFARLLIEMEQGGYDAEWQVLNSKDFGVPQNRERVFIIGHLRGRSTSEIFPVEGADGENSVHLILDGCINGRNSQRDRIYSKNGLCPTIATKPGGNTEPKVAIPCFIDLSYKKTKLTDTARCLQARYAKGPSMHEAETSGVAIKIIGQINSSQDGQIHSVDGIAKCHSAGHNNSPKIAVPVLTPDRTEKRQNGRRFKENGEPMFTLTGQDRHGVGVAVEVVQMERSESETGIYVKFPNGVVCYAVWYEKYQCYIAIRKLTPKECFRLQGWTDDYFEKAAFVNSDSQLYKQSGNGVTVNVIYEIAKRLKECGKD